MSRAAIGNHEFGDQPIIVESATLGDAEGIFNVLRLTWLDTYPNANLGITEEDARVRVEGEQGELAPEKIERWRKRIEETSDKQATFVVHKNGKVVGFAASDVRDGQRLISAIYVLPDAQGEGIGGELLRKAIEWHEMHGPGEDIYLHVASYTNKAIKFYEKHGFKITGKAASDEAAQLRNGKTIPLLTMKKLRDK